MSQYFQQGVYAPLQTDHGQQSLDAAKGYSSIYQSADQNSRENTKSQREGEEYQRAQKKRKMGEMGKALETLEKVAPEQRQSAWTGIRQGMIKDGVIGEGDALEQYDEGEHMRGLSQWKQSDDYREREMQNAKLSLTRAQAEAAVPDSKAARELIQSQIRKNNAEAGKPGFNISDGQKAVDKDYAKDYNNFTQKGAVNASAAIDGLETLATELEGDVGFGEAGGGRIASVLPDAMRSRDAIRRRDSARNFANTTIKELFPGAVSDSEREAAAKSFYNDSLDNKENAKILRAKIAQFRAAHQQEAAKAKHYEQYGTLIGFKGDLRPSFAGNKTPPPGGPGATGSWDGMNQANADGGAPPANQRKPGTKVSKDEVIQYAAKHGMKETDAREFLRISGYAPD